MKSLAELQSVLSVFPRPFASNGRKSDFPIDEGAGGKTNFETGIPSDYSPAAHTDSLMPRGDFNRIGEIATRELFFRSAGGIHTFDSGFSSVNAGYADGIALAYDDGKFVRTVESQEKENDLDFKSNPAAIDALANKPSDAEGTDPRVLWKSASRVYGLAEGLLHVCVDYSRMQTLSSGEALDNDSFVVIGASFYGWSDIFVDSRPSQTAGSYSITVAVGEFIFTWDNKGLQGEVAGGIGLLNPMFGPIYPYKIYGGANAPFAFFAPKGTVITYSATANGEPIGQTGIYANAFPLEAGRSGEGGAE